MTTFYYVIPTNTMSSKRLNFSKFEFVMNKANICNDFFIIIQTYLIIQTPLDMAQIYQGVLLPPYKYIHESHHFP